jgi:hypothetical protein
MVNPNRQSAIPIDNLQSAIQSAIGNAIDNPQSAIR